ncbi:MAG: hypothetical protein KC464_04340, partial [Myxococcales bacterium]|nr:hypothetical protein [Myxococcales bacterium]
PSDLFLDSDGLLALTTLPTGPSPVDDNVTMLRDGLHTLDGAGLRSNAYFPITLAAGADVDADTIGDAAVLLDLDASTSTALATIAADVYWRADVGAIAVVPVRGTVLAPGHRYAAYLTDDAHATDGSPLGATAAFRAAVELATTPADGAVAAAQASLRPLLEVLPAATRDHLVAATVFRTATYPDQTRRMRDVLAASPPTITILDVVGPDEADLAAIMGTQPADAIPGTCEDNTRAQPHDHVALLVQGTIDLPSFQSATANVDGFPTFEADGTPIIKGTHPVKFTLTLPVAASWDALPVAIYVHGIGRSRHDMLTQVNTAARAGMALLAIDLPYHGDRANRAANQMDTRNELLGTDVPDGFGDDYGLFPSTALFHLGSSGGIPGYHPEAMGENLRAAALEVSSLVAFVRDGDLTPLVAAVAPIAGLPDTISFRDDVALLTESLGVMITGVTLAVEPGLGVAYLSSPAAGFPEPSMMHSPNYAGLFLSGITEPYGVGDRVDVAVPARDARVEPIVMLFDNVVERGDALAYAPLVTSGALRGGTSPDVVVAMGWGDVWVSNDTEEQYAKALDLPVATLAQPPPPADDPVTGGLVRFVTLDPTSWPVSGNRTGGASGVFVVLHPAGHAMIRKYVEQRNFEPLFPPYVALSPPKPIFPTGTPQVHRLWSELFVDHFDGGGAVTIRDPYRDAITWPSGVGCP